jgi:DNA-binding NarL/FixJ family response regulator
VVLSDDPAVADRLAAALADTGSADVVDSGEKVRRSNGSRHVDLVVWHTGSIAIDSLPPDLPVLGVGPSESEAMLAAFEAGAQGYVDIGASASEIVQAARSVASGTAVVTPRLLGPLLRAVVDRRRKERSQRDTLAVLTLRERQVFELAAKGFTRSQLATELIISPATARTHLQKLMAKLDIHSQAELVALAARCGLDTQGITHE